VILRYNVLITDDDEAVVHSLMRTLHSADYNLASVKSGEDGLSYMQNHTVDLIIADYKLGGMNGVDFLEAVFKEHPEVVAILITGQADVKIVADAVNRFSLYKFFVKPWDNLEIQNAVREAFKKRDASRPREITAVDIMSKFPVTIKEDVPLLAAAELMMRFKISGMPVMSLSGKLTGIITATDLFRIMGEQEEKTASGRSSSAGDLRIAEVMSKDVYTIKKDTPLQEMIRIMFGKNIHTMPVVEGDELVGIVGRRDILNTYYRGSHVSKSN
jgi:CBS domain-containing protein